MNNDLISRSALLEDAYMTGMWNRVTRAFDLCVVDLEDVQNAPAVDAEPVRHGRWINKTEPQYAELEMRFDCSVCHHIFYAGGVETFRYCPWCGAKMDGGADGD